MKRRMTTRLMRLLPRKGQFTRATILAGSLLVAPRGTTQQNPSWLEPFAPFRIAENLYYVGSRGLASYLVTTSEGHILINSNLDAGVPLIRASVEKLGFRFADIKVLLISHSHHDHDAGSARIKELTGARYMVMEGDVATVQSGGRSDFHYGTDSTQHYPAAKVDRVLKDGDEVRLGGAVLTAHLTPGHTMGCTTWTLKVTEGGKSYNVVIIGSPNVNPGYKLVGNVTYPRIAEDFEKTFLVLKSLPVDYFLGSHGSYFDMERKVPLMKQGARSPFIDPDGYRAYVADRERAFRAELSRQRSAGR
jgi:metallo-beta-lactamase class B